MPPVPLECSVLVVAETLAAILRGVVRLEVGRDFTPEEVALLGDVDRLGRAMREDADVEPDEPTPLVVGDCDEAA